LSYGDSITTITERERIVTSARTNFTEPPVGTYFLTILPAEGTRIGDQVVDIDFNYYRYDPMCVEFTKWNGTDCVQQYDEFCASFKPQFVEKLNMTDFEVVYNGS